MRLDDLDEFLEEYKPLELQFDYSGKGRQWLTFLLGTEKYGVEVLKVQELIGYTSLTYLPQMPPYIKGLFNLRGLVVPVVDLRLRLGMSEKEYSKYTVVIMLQIHGKLMGMAIDEVSEVIFLHEDQIQDISGLSTQINMKFIQGMGRFKDELVILLDLDNIFLMTEIAQLTGTTQDNNIFPTTTGSQLDMGGK